MRAGSTLSRELAIHSLHERMRLERLADREASRFGSRLRGALLRAYAIGQRADLVFAMFEQQWTDVLLGTLVSGHIAGEDAVDERFEVFQASRRPLAFDQRATVRRIVGKARTISPERLAQISMIYERHAARTAADGIGVISGRLADVDLEAKRQEIRSKLDLAGVGAEKPHLLKTMVRTQLHMGYSAGKLARNQHPLIAESLWGYEYVAIDDTRVRPNHIALNGTRLPKDDPYWNVIMPPNGYNCRCDVIEVWRDEDPAAAAPDEQVEVDGELVAPGPDKGWDFPPSDIMSSPVFGLAGVK
jgi:SPP1 gp7 family putative phage head morphogenesis protein